MPIGAQPPRRRGTVGHAYSALNLRLLLATFGLVTSTVFAFFLFRSAITVGAWFFVALAVIAVVDVVVILLRRRARRRSGDTGRSLFE